MTFTYSIYDLANDLARVRRRIGDTESASAIFQDEELEQFLADEDDDWRLASALALETIASSQVLLLKVVRILDIQTDGAAVARELRQQARELREQAAELVAAAEAEDAIDVIEMVTDDFGYRQHIRNLSLRGQL